jgi:drug/metabolite transporter (DMT)-like permease
MRRPTTVELMLLATVVLWALNLTISKYILSHGFQPLSYAAARYGLAALVFVGLVLATERTLRVLRGDVGLVLLAAGLVWLNQMAFVYALDTGTASTLALLLGAIPIFAALLGLALGTERVSRRFWGGAVVSFVGVALVAVGAGARLSGGLDAIVLGLATAATWAAYSVTITPLMRRYSPYRISALVLSLAFVPIALAALPQTTSQDWALGWEVWALFFFATVGPLVVTNVLWFRSLHRIGPARATLAVNLQPFVAAVFALVLLSESLTWLQVAGGVLIGLGIFLARGRRRPRPAASSSSA